MLLLLLLLTLLIKVFLNLYFSVNNQIAMNYKANAKKNLKEPQQSIGKTNFEEYKSEPSAETKLYIIEYYQEIGDIP